MIRKKYLRGLLRAVIMEKRVEKHWVRAKQFRFGLLGTARWDSAIPPLYHAGCLGVCWAAPGGSFLHSFLKSHHRFLKKEKIFLSDLRKRPLENSIGFSWGPRRDFLRGRQEVPGLSWASITLPENDSMPGSICHSGEQQSKAGQQSVLYQGRCPARGSHLSPETRGSKWGRESLGYPRNPFRRSLRLKLVPD